LKAEIRFERISKLKIGTAFEDGVLLGRFTFDVAIQPIDIARVLTFQKQNDSLNMVLESPQATLDLQIQAPVDGQALVKLIGSAAPDAIAMPLEGGPFKCQCGYEQFISPGTSSLDCTCGRGYKFIFKAPAMMPLTFADIVFTKPEEEGGVYRAKIDSYEGEGGDAKSAIVAALCGAGLIHINGQAPAEIYNELIEKLTESYKENARAKAVAAALTLNSFDVEIPEAKPKKNGKRGKKAGEEGAK
jgi:hypothetical protein